MANSAAPHGRMYSKGARKRAEIVSAAFEAFSVSGYRNASMVQIAATCGVSRAGMAHHFPTKETLLAAVLEERDRVNGELFFHDFDPTADGLDYFARLMRVIEHNATTPVPSACTRRSRWKRPTPTIPPTATSSTATPGYGATFDMLWPRSPHGGWSGPE